MPEPLHIRAYAPEDYDAVWALHNLALDAVDAHGGNGPWDDDLHRVLELDVARIRVVQPAVGGAFGGKSEPFDLEFCVAKLALLTGRPVKCLYTREEVFYSHRGRHPMQMSFKPYSPSSRAEQGNIFFWLQPMD